jgi:hypothetical protein
MKIAHESTVPAGKFASAATLPVTPPNPGPSAGRSRGELHGHTTTITLMASRVSIAR